MMFSSNQVLEVSGSLLHENEIESALEFALKYSGEEKNMQPKEIKRGCKLLYQITKDGKYCIGKYCIGWGFESIPEGWLEYPFKFDIGIVSRIIRKHIYDFPLEVGNLDGNYEKGFIMQCINKCMSAEKDGIKSPDYGIVYFKPYTCFYSK